jgi:hypothetical protein
MGCGESGVSGWTVFGLRGPVKTDLGIGKRQVEMRAVGIRGGCSRAVEHWGRIVGAARGYAKFTLAGAAGFWVGVDLSA